MSETPGSVLETGEVVSDRYQILRHLGRGGLASVYLVHDQLWGMNVALKLVHSSSPERLETLRSEFSVLCGLCHRGLVQVHDFGLLATAAETPERVANCFYTCRFVDGVTLNERASSCAWDAIRVPLIDALEALWLLHGAGIRHGDFTPSNILVSDSGGVLIDLSCCRPLRTAGESEIGGTQRYLAPEVLAGEAADARADLYAVGVTLQTLMARVSGRVPASVRALAERLTRERPDQRPSDVGEVLEVLGAARIAERPVAASGALLEREQELRQAQAMIAALVGQQPGARVLQIAGRPGMGKSRLLRELKWQAQMRCRVVEANPAVPLSLRSLLLRLLRRSELPSAIDESLLLLRSWAEREPTPIVLVIDDLHALEGDEFELARAIAQSIEPSDPFSLLLSSHPELSLAGLAVERIEIGPLSARAVTGWCAGILGDVASARVHEATSGVPAGVHATLQLIASGVLSEADVQHVDLGFQLPERVAALVRQLDESEQRALGLIVLADRPLSASDVAGFAISASIEPLVRQGLVEREGIVFKLAPPWTRSLVDALSPDQVRKAHAELAEWTDRQAAQASSGSDRSRLVALVVGHLVAAGKIGKARQRWAAEREQHAAAPRAWAHAAGLLAAHADDPELQLEAARLVLASGDSQGALARLESLARLELPAALASECCLLRSECRLRLGDLERAEREARTVHAGSEDSLLRARAAHVVGRALVRLDRYREALELTEAELIECRDPMLRSDLLETAAVAHGFLGDSAAALERLSQAASILSELEDPRRLARAHANRALIEHQQGELDRARAGFAQALELADQNGLTDQIANAALNLGTACHQQGDWTAAHSCYERANRCATALGQRSTQAFILFNLAKLYADIGLFERAQAAALRAEALADDAKLALVAAASRVVRAEVACGRGQPEDARLLLSAATDTFAAHGSAYEQAEVTLQQAEVELMLGNLLGAREVVDSITAEVEAPDLRVRLLLFEARTLRAENRASDSLPVLEAALKTAQSVGQRELEAEAELELSRTWQAQGSSLLAQRHRTQAAEIWERAAALLPVEMRQAFWKHPRRAGARIEPNEPLESNTSTRERKLSLLMDINKKLNSSLKTRQVLQRAMDAALDLTGAERGFVLLSEDPTERRRMRVATARNLDQMSLDGLHVKFSRGIAERVIATGQPLVTTNAQADARLSQDASVHAMRLQSVLCVPVASPSGVLGALYLDNRLQRGRFSEQDVDLLLAFADQVAIALENARLHKELADRNRELEVERRRIEEALRGREAEIDRLLEQARERQGVQRHRFDYSAMVGSSPEMEAVFSILDRVIDINLPVLIHGESGTGKELIARAIHANDPHRSGPLVAINCAALPESLLESELFGYERGAFTGAEQARRGLVIEAKGGILFLDEIGELPVSMQAKLLRVLQEREVRPLGSRQAIPVDFRLVCATNRRLRDEVQLGRFREDLYYRISTIELTLPPLRERAQDIPELVMFLLRRMAEQMGRPVPELTRQALRKLMGCPWPGNVRQLENVLARAMVLAENDQITAPDIELPARSQPSAAAPGRDGFAARERERMLQALESNRWNVRQAAKLLGIPRPTFYRKLKRYGLGRSSR